MLAKLDQCLIESILIHLMKHGIKQIIILQLQTLLASETRTMYMSTSTSLGHNQRVTGSRRHH